MGIKIAGIDIASAVVNLEVQLKTTQNLLSWIMASNSSSLALPTSDDIAQIKKASLEEIQKKYPEAGIKEVKS